jgi:murein DD-endopeptidase MepM/ murein hydrolase activator NlpD
MLRLFTTILFITMTIQADAYNIPVRNNNRGDYIIVGQNTVQKIKYITSSSFSEIHRGNRALDSDRATSWVSKNGNSPHWFEIDFGVKRLMSTIIIYPGQKDNYKTIKYLYLQFMYRNRWFTFSRIHFSRETAPEGEKVYGKKAVIDLGGIDASSFRILIPENATYNGYASISEIETHLGSSKIKYFDERLKGLFLPIKNAFLPAKDSGYPNAPRRYRGGRHVGIDFFYQHTEDSYEPVLVTKKTPVHAADSGTIIRCDINYKPMTATEWKGRSNYYKKHPRTFVMRSFGGRQVWIDHHNGIVTAYNHLSRIDHGLKKGSKVKKGQRIGWVGNSGLYGEALGKDWGAHLHMEIWIDGYYLGYGMKMKDVKKYVKWVFFPLQ